MSGVSEIRGLTPADAGGMWALLKLAGWAVEEPELPEWVGRMISGSYLVLGAFAGGELIGTARCLSDGVGDAYIQDVVVAAEWRGRGVGGRLVDLLVERLTAAGVDWIGLVATPGHADLYRHHGFAELEGFTPMRYGSSS